MTNEIIKKMLQDGYNKLAYTNHYILVYSLNGTVFFTIGTHELVDRVTCLDKASRGAGYALRFKPNKAQKMMLLVENATPICSTEFFNDTVANSKYNKGEIAEKFVTEYFGQVWEKDNIPYTEAGDIEVDGIAYQIKYEKATFTNEKSLRKMMARG